MFSQLKFLTLVSITYHLSSDNKDYVYIIIGLLLLAVYLLSGTSTSREYKVCCYYLLFALSYKCCFPIKETPAVEIIPVRVITI